MPDVQIHPTGQVAAPAAYRIPDVAELLLKTVFAKFDGSGAASPFLPLVRIKSDAGTTVVEAVADSSVAAGASADASWFPFVASRPSTASGGIRFDFDNVGGSLEVETTGLVPSAFSQPAASANPATDYGTALNADNGLLITAPPDSVFNSGNPVVDIEDFKTTGDLGAWGQLIRAEDRTPNGTNDVIGQQIIASADGIQNAVGETVESSMGVDGTADAFAGAFGASNQGAGREVAVTALAGIHKSGANALCYEGTDAGGNTVFYVDSAGNIHIKATSNLFRDLP